MLTRPIESYRKASILQHKSLHTAVYNFHQHGSPSLLDIPRESLTHITSYLPPPSLLALSRTCRYLCEHVDDDNTWLRAFLTQFLGISPEHEHECILLLRRTEYTWRKEFIVRYATKRCVAFAPIHRCDLARFPDAGSVLATRPSLMCPRTRRSTACILCLSTLS